MSNDKTQADSSNQSSQLAQMYKALESLMGIQRLVQSEDWNNHLLPLLRAMLIRKWLNPSDYSNRDSFFDAYLENLAEVNVSERFLSQFDPDNLNARIKELNKQIIREGAKSAE